MDKIEEIVGTILPAPHAPIQAPNMQTQSNIPTATDIRVAGPTLSHCGQLENWQQQIVNQLNTGHDQYVIARPGGGKTLPIICYWTTHLLTLNTVKIPGNIHVGQNNQQISNAIQTLFYYGNDLVEVYRNVPKLVMLVPVITLAQQTAAEIRRHLASIMYQAYNNNPDHYITRFLQHHSRNIQNIFQERGTSINNLNAAQNTATAPGLNINQRRDSQNADLYQTKINSLTSNLKTEVENAIQTIVNRLVYVRTGSFRSSTPLNQALVYVSIYESAPSFINDIERLELVVIDEAHLIQESGNPNDDNSRAFQITSQLSDTLNSIRRHETCRLAMLTGTVNPESATNVVNYLNACYGRSFTRPVQAPESARNRSTISIVPNESINDTNGIIKLIVSSVSRRDWGQLYVLFSTNRINQIVEQCIEKLGTKDPESTVGHGYTFDNTFSGLGRHRQEQQTALDAGAIDRMSIPPGTHLNVANITNPLLRQAVLRGIGFIYRNIPGNELEGRAAIQMNDRDKQIVAKLFRERKISVLLATDAVGIGVNIDVKDLYIPSTEKFSNNVKGMISVSLRDLSQILNRAGRGATPIATIHTPKRNMEMVTDAMYASPEDMPSVDEISKARHIYCNNRFFAYIRNSIFGRGERWISGDNN